MKKIFLVILILICGNVFARTSTLEKPIDQKSEKAQTRAYGLIVNNYDITVDKDACELIDHKDYYAFKCKNIKQPQKAQ